MGKAQKGHNKPLVELREKGALFIRFRSGGEPASFKTMFRIAAFGNLI